MPNNHPLQLLNSRSAFQTRRNTRLSHHTRNPVFRFACQRFDAHRNRTLGEDGNPILMLNIFAQHPLLEALREYNRDYLFQDYICSLGRETTAEQIQEMIPGHWQRENCLHLAKDKFYGEDKYAFRVPGMGEIWTAMTGIATTLLQLMYKGERTLKEIRERFRETPAAVLQ